jgi:hypothetical protein
VGIVKGKGPQGYVEALEILSQRVTQEVQP